MTRFATPLAAAVVTVVTLGLSGCAALGPMGHSHEVDQAKVAQIERAASTFGIRVVWLNPPTKRVEKTGG